MQCPSCNDTLSDESQFCVNCGSIINIPAKVGQSPKTDIAIGYGTTFTTSFLGLSTTLRVVSPVNVPAPRVNVVISFTKDNSARSVSLSGDFFESLLAILASIRKHTDLLAGAEFGFLASGDHQAILFSEVGTAQVKVLRKKGVLGAKDIAQVSIDELNIERELNDEFFSKILGLQSTIEQVKRKIADKIRAYNAHRKV